MWACSRWKFVQTVVVSLLAPMRRHEGRNVRFRYGDLNRTFLYSSTIQSMYAIAIQGMRGLTSHRKGRKSSWWQKGI